VQNPDVHLQVISTTVKVFISLSHKPADDVFTERPPQLVWNIRHDLLDLTVRWNTLTLQTFLSIQTHRNCTATHLNYGEGSPGSQNTNFVNCCDTMLLYVAAQCNRVRSHTLSRDMATCLWLPCAISLKWYNKHPQSMFFIQRDPGSGGEYAMQLPQSYWYSGHCLYTQQSYHCVIKHIFTQILKHCKFSKRTLCCKLTNYSFLPLM
jgi:hypothetical protein